MAAAYQAGTASSPIDFLQQLVTFLVAQGWTSDASAADGTGWRAHLHKGSLYVNLRAAVNEKIWGVVPYDQSAGYGIGMYLGTGYSGASAWYAQAGGPNRGSDGQRCGSGMNLFSGSASYDFFDDGEDNITIVGEKTPGLFGHIGWGPALIESGHATPFPYQFGSSDSYYMTRVSGTPLDPALPGLNATADTPMAHSQYTGHPLFSTQGIGCCAFIKVPDTVFLQEWLCNGGDSGQSDAYLWTGRNFRCRLNQASTPSAINEAGYPNYKYLIGRMRQTAVPGTVLLPLVCYMQNGLARFTPIGYPRSVFYCEGVGSGFAARAVLPIGGVNYMLFPKFAVLKAA